MNRFNALCTAEIERVAGRQVGKVLSSRDADFRNNV